MSEFCLLNLVVNPAIEDAVGDWLLAHDQISGFSSINIAGHGSSEQSMNLAEQVAGRQRQVLFQSHLPCTLAYAIIDSINHEFKGSGIHYWLLPVLASGRIQ